MSNIQSSASLTHNLLSTVKLGGMTLANRVVMAPLTRARAGNERLPNDLMVKYYQQRASAGLIISEATVVSKQGIGWQNSPGIYEEEQVSGWRKVTKAVHDAGGRMFLQLWHCGRSSHSTFHNGELPVAPSPVLLQGDGIYTPSGKMSYETPRALTTDEVPQLVQDYERACGLAKEAGFDGIEIHAANGYLVDQFLQSKTNLRTDMYGGSMPGRFRLLREIVEVAKKVWEPGRIGVRLSPNGVFNDMGSPDYREMFLYTAAELATYQIGYLHVLDGLAFGFHNLGEPISLQEARSAFPSPGLLIGNCGYNQETGDAAIASGNADMIAFGRPFISNPDLVDRFRNGWSLADQAEMAVWYSFDDKGYADFPTYSE